MKGKLKMPTTDEECRALLRDICGRTEEQIDAIFEFAKLTKELEKNKGEREWKNMKKPYCPECNVKLDLYSITYEFECPECGLQFGMECEEDMQQIVWK